MGIFNRKNNKETGLPEGIFSESEDDPRVDIYTPEMLVKRLLWDIVPCDDVDEILPLMGLTPDSEEVREMEHRSSHTRMEQVAPLQEMLDLLSPLVSGITASAMLVNSGVETDEETAVALQKHHSLVIRAGVVAIIANLLDMGLLVHANGVEIR